MKTLALLAVVLLLPVAFAESVESVEVSDGRCTFESGFAESIKAQIFSELKVSSEGFVNLTSSSCWESESGKNVYFAYVVKESEDSIRARSVSVSLSSYEFRDVDSQFTEEESRVMDYTLKNNYIEFMENGTDEEYYIRITPEYESESGQYQCEDLQSIYESLEGEKYFNEQSEYCEIIVKTTTSQIKTLVVDGVGYIGYFGDEVNYLFEGYSEGEFDLENLRNSLDCDFNQEDYYLSEIKACTGNYQPEERFYFSASKEFEDAWVYVNAYGFNEQKGKITVGISGESAEKYKDAGVVFVSEVTEKFFGKALVPTLEESEYAYEADTTAKYYEGSAIVNNIKVNTESLGELESSEDKMNTYYSGENIYLTINQPYIQLFLSSGEGEVLEGSVSSEAKIMPFPYYSDSIIIMDDKVFAQVILDKNDDEAAKEAIKAKVNDFVETGDWNTEMTVTGEYQIYPMRGMVAEDSKGMEVSGGSGGNSQAVPAAYDTFDSDHPEFNELNAPESFIIRLIRWISGFF